MSRPGLWEAEGEAGGSEGDAAAAGALSLDPSPCHEEKEPCARMRGLKQLELDSPPRYSANCPGFEAELQPFQGPLNSASAS